MSALRLAVVALAVSACAATTDEQAPHARWIRDLETGESVRLALSWWDGAEGLDIEGGRPLVARSWTRAGHLWYAEPTVWQREFELDSLTALLLDHCIHRARTPLPGAIASGKVTLGIEWRSHGDDVETEFHDPDPVLVWAAERPHLLWELIHGDADDPGMSEDGD